MGLIGKGNINCHIPNDKYRERYDNTKFDNKCSRCKFKNYKGHREWCKKSKHVIIGCAEPQ